MSRDLDPFHYTVDSFLLTLLTDLDWLTRDPVHKSFRVL